MGNAKTKETKLPIESEICGKFYSEKIAIPHTRPFTGKGTYRNDYVELNADFVQSEAVKVFSIKYVNLEFIFDVPSEDTEVLQKINTITRKKHTYRCDIENLITGQGTFLINEKTIKGQFLHATIQEGEIKTQKYSFIGTIRDYEPVEGVLTKQDYIYTGKLPKYINSSAQGTIEYKNGDTYKGDIATFNSRNEYEIYKGGTGVLTTKNSRIIGMWQFDMIDRVKGYSEKFNNGLLKEENKNTVKLSLKINIKDFLLDMQYLSGLFENPPKIEDETQTYDLNFEGDIQGNFPKRGRMSIYKVFRFNDGVWDEKKELQCDGDLTDLVNGRIYKARYNDGIGIHIPLNESKVIIGTATYEEGQQLEGQQLEEGQI